MRIAEMKTALRQTADRARFYANLPEMMMLLKFRTLRARFYRELWHAAAANIEAQSEDWPAGLVRITSDGLSTFVKGYDVMLDSGLIQKITSDKALTYRLMLEAGAPVVAHRTFNRGDLSPALDFLAEIDAPVVIKPAAGTGAGRGVTVGVMTGRDLQGAANYAARFAPELLVEQQLFGSSYRLLFLGGRYIDAIRRDPPCLVGDGVRTVRQLVAAENQRRLKTAPAVALSPLRIDPDMKRTLATQGLTLRSNPEPDRVFRVKTVVNENAAEDNHSVRNLVHPETIAKGRDLVARLGLRFAGLDVICDDISIPLGPGNGVFGEINTTPGLHHHELLSDQSRRAAIAEQVLIHMFASREGVMSLAPDNSQATYRSRLAAKPEPVDAH